MKDWSSDIIDFEPVAHSYTNRRTKRKYLGITTFIGKFEPKFDTEYWSAREAVKRLYGDKSYKYNRFKRAVTWKPKQIVYDAINKSVDKDSILLLQKQVIKEWSSKNKVAIDKGSAYHAKQEDKLNFNKYRIIEGGVKHLADVSKFPKSYGNKTNLAFNLPDGIHPEILLLNHEYELAGQADYFFIETINGVRYVDIDDYKTNEKLTFRNQYENFHAPIDFLEHHKMNIYQLQILLYAWLAEQCGFVIRKCTLTYHPNYNTPPIVYEIVPFRTEKNPIELMLKHRKNQLQSLNLHN